MIKVKNTYILVDFVVLDMDGDLGILLILGCPFLKDANARIDVGERKNQSLNHGKDHEIQVLEQKGGIPDARG